MIQKKKEVDFLDISVEDLDDVDLGIVEVKKEKTEDTKVSTKRKINKVVDDDYDDLSLDFEAELIQTNDSRTGNGVKSEGITTCNLLTF